MRLIDADTYATEMRKRQDACRKWKSEQNVGSEMYARAEQALVTFVEAWVTLENQPTIDAIPVEWLMKVLAEANEFPISERETIVAIPYFVKRWQKEQEAR